MRRASDPLQLTGTVDVQQLELPEHVAAPLDARLELAGTVGTVTSPLVVWRGWTLRDVNARIAWDAAGFRLDPAQAQLAGGVLTGAVTWARSAAGRMHPEGWVKLRGADVNELSATRLPEGRVTGVVEAEGSFDGAAGLSAINADLDLAVVEGAFVALPVAALAAESLGLPPALWERWPFRNLAGHVKVRAGRLQVDSLRIEQEGILWRAAGSIGPGGDLDLAGSLIADPTRIRLPAAIEVLARTVADDGGRIPVDFALDGPATSARLRFDWDEFSRRVAERARDRQGERLEQILEDTVKDPEVLQRLRDVLKKKP